MHFSNGGGDGIHGFIRMSRFLSILRGPIRILKLDGVMHTKQHPYLSSSPSCCLGDGSDPLIVFRNSGFWCNGLQDFKMQVQLYRRTKLGYAFLVLITVTKIQQETKDTIILCRVRVHTKIDRRQWRLKVDWCTQFVHGLNLNCCLLLLLLGYIENKNILIFSDDLSEVYYWTVHSNNMENAYMH